MLVDRRAFLRRAAVLGGAVALGGRDRLGAALWQEPAGSLLDQPANECPVDTIVVICMENRSFDHYFGWLASDERYLEHGRSRYGAGFSVDAVNQLAYRRPDGSEASTFYLPEWEDSRNPYRGCGGHPDPGHGWHSGRVQRDAGFVADGSGNDDFALGYLTATELPCYSQLARGSTIFDRYFCSVLASTYPNRYYLHSAQAGGQKGNDLPYPEPFGWEWPTIWDRLGPAGVSAGMYAVDLPTTALWGPRMIPVTHSIARLFADAAAGTLPHVTYIDPGFLTGMRTDDHPHADMRLGQKFVASMLDVLQSSPQWGRMAVFTTYDEWGGFFDHVAPPVLPDDLASPDDLENFGQAGFRLPVTLHSPYARPGYVDHRVYDHTSLLRFIEWRFLGAPAEGPAGDGWWLTARDRNANNIGAALADRPVNDFLIDASAVPLVVSTPCNGQWFQDAPGPNQLEDQVTPVLNDAGVDLDDVAAEVRIGGEPSTFELARDAGMYERFGYDTEPSLTLRELLG